MTKKLYLQCFRAFQSVLNMETQLTIADLCTKLGCINSRSLAAQLMQKYVGLASEGGNRVVIFFFCDKNCVSTLLK